MKTVRRRRSVPKPRQLAALRLRLAEAEEALRAIRRGEVDAVVVTGRRGRQVFTLHGAEHAYRVLIESMNEGALTLTANKTILYANQCFAKMVRCPLAQVMGGSFLRFLSPADRALLRSLLKRPAPSGTKIQMRLKASDGTQIPVQVSLRLLPRNGSSRVTIGVVVTDATESRRTEELLRALAHRVVQVQETERSHVALELHDNITQQLCAVLYRSQALADVLSRRDGPAKGEAMNLRDQLSRTAGEVERIARNLRPSVLEHLGLAAVLNATTTEFAERTGVSVRLTCGKLTIPLSTETELAFYRVLQEALKNVERHARARHVEVRLKQRAAGLELAIDDDGVGFDPDRHPAARNGASRLGLLGMRERATYVGGALTIKSGHHDGTEITLRVPASPGPAAVNGKPRKTFPRNARRKRTPVSR